MGFLSNLLLGDNSNKTSYKDAAYDKYYGQITGDTFDRAYEGSREYLDKYGGGYDRVKNETIFGLNDQAKNSLANYNATKNNHFGNGLIGSLLNPIAQTADSLGSLTGLALSGGKVNAWDGSKDALGVKRDIGSDIGAGLNTALTLGTMGHGMSLAKAGKAVGAGTATAKQAAKWAASQAPKTLGQKIAGGALMGAGYGATGSLRDMGFENFDPGQFALSTGIGAGVGGGMAGLGSLWNKATTARVPVKTGDATPYQEALNNLKNNATSPARYSDVTTNLPTLRGMDTARITLDNLDDDTLKQLYKSSLKNVRSKAGANEATTAVKANRDLLQEMLKNGVPTSTSYETVKAKGLGEALKNLKTNAGNTKYGKKVADLLKTKRGKVIAGAGGGLLLAKLLRGNQQSNVEPMSQDELYNYIYGGGQI